MNLPHSNILPIKYLSAVYNNTTNSYKFYWFLGILECLRKYNKEEIYIDDIVIEMIAGVWYPINYFNLSFGKQDQLERNVILLKEELKLKKDINKEELVIYLKDKANQTIINNLLFNLKRYIPFRFLSPWYNNSLRGLPDKDKNRIIYLNTRKYINHPSESPIYKFSDNMEKIILSKEWFEYLLIHFSIIKAFTLWHLIRYLQKNNPNSPNLQEKLFPPQFRKLTAAKNYWQTYIEKFTDIKCVYSNQILTKDNMSIDHFVAAEIFSSILPV